MRLDAYIRVSRVAGREGDSFISPELQRDRCDGIARAGGHTIITWHEDLDQPGSKSERPGFQAALSRVENGETDGIVVARLDRFARSVADAALALRRINAAGGSLISAHESLDTSSSFGRFGMHMMLALAELELDRIREGWDAARARAVGRGVHIASRTPTGYLRDDAGVLERDPRSAEAIAEVFRAKARGASWGELAAILEGAGVKTPYGGIHWNSRSLSHVLSNRVYLGEARSGEHIRPKSHPPLIDRATWAQAQRSKRRPSMSTGGSLLAGLLRCGGCRHVLKSDRMTDRSGEKLRLYRCRGHFAAGRCPAPTSVLGRVIEPWIEETFLDAMSDIAAQGAESSEDIDRARDALASAEAELASYLEADLAAVVGAERFRAGAKDRQARVEEAEAGVHQAFERSAPVGEIVRLGPTWAKLSIPERRHLLSLAIDAVFLRRTGKITVPIAERSLILWRGEAPDDLPGPGRRNTEITGFEWGA